MSVAGGIGPWITAETNDQKAPGATSPGARGSARRTARHCRRRGRSGEAGGRSPDRPPSASVPADRLLVEVDEHLLGLEILLDAPMAKLPAEPRRLVTAPRGFDEGRLHVVDPDDAGLERLHHAKCLEDVS